MPSSAACVRLQMLGEKIIAGSKKFSFCSQEVGHIARIDPAFKSTKAQLEIPGKPFSIYSTLLAKKLCLNICFGCRRAPTTDSCLLLAARTRQSTPGGETSGFRGNSQLQQRSKPALPRNSQSLAQQEPKPTSLSLLNQQFRQNRARQPTGSGSQTMKPSMALQPSSKKHLAAPQAPDSGRTPGRHLLQARSVNAQVQLEPPLRLPEQDQVARLQKLQAERQAAARAVRLGQLSPVELPAERLENPRDKASAALKDSPAWPVQAQTESELRSDAQDQQQEAAETEQEQAARVARLKTKLPEILVVDEVSEAERVCKLLMAQPRERVFACDTEVGLLTQSPASQVDHPF